MKKTWFQRLAGLLCTALVLGVVIDLVERRNRAASERTRQQEVVEVLEPYLPRADDADLVITTKTVNAPESLGPRPVDVLLRTRDGAPAGLVFWLNAVNGYGGPVELALGIDARGRVAGIGAIAHRETPGFGDVIDSGWLENLRGASLTQPPPEQWKLRSQSGQFDGVSGATITLQAVIDGVRRALQYYQQNEKYLYDG